MISKLAHDLLIDITDFKVNLEVPKAGFTSGSLELGIQANSLKVICTLKDKERTNALKEKDISYIEKRHGCQSITSGQVFKDWQKD